MKPFILKFFYYNLINYLNGKDLLYLSQINKYARNICQTDEFWRYKLQDSFEIFVQHKPTKLNYLQWFLDIEKGRGCLKEIKTLYVFHNTVDPVISNENIRSHKIGNQNVCVKKIEGAMVFGQTSRDEVWMIDICGRMRCEKAEVSAHASELSRYFSDGVISRRTMRMKNLYSTGEETVCVDTRDNIWTLESNKFTRATDLGQCKTLMGSDTSVNIYVLCADGKLYERKAHRFTITGRKIKGEWSLIDHNVNYLGQSNYRQFFYKKDNGCWCHYDHGYHTIVSKDINIIQMNELSFHTGIVQNAISVLYKDGNIKFYHIRDNIDQDKAGYTIENLNIKSIHHPKYSNTAFFLSNDHQLYLWGKNTYFPHLPVDNAEPVMVDKDVLDVKYRGDRLIIFKKYGSTINF